MLTKSSLNGEARYVLLYALPWYLVLVQHSMERLSGVVIEPDFAEQLRPRGMLLSYHACPPRLPEDAGDLVGGYACSTNRKHALW